MVDEPGNANGELISDRLARRMDIGMKIGFFLGIGLGITGSIQMDASPLAAVVFVIMGAIAGILYVGICMTPIISCLIDCCVPDDNPPVVQPVNQPDPPPIAPYFELNDEPNPYTIRLFHSREEIINENRVERHNTKNTTNKTSSRSETELNSLVLEIPELEIRSSPEHKAVASGSLLSWMAKQKDNDQTPTNNKGFSKHRVG